MVHVAEYPYPLRDRCQRASGAKSRFSKRFHQGSACCAARNSCVGWTVGCELVGMGDSPELEGVRAKGASYLNESIVRGKSTHGAARRTFALARLHRLIVVACPATPAARELFCGEESPTLAARGAARRSASRRPAWIDRATTRSVCSMRPHRHRAKTAGAGDSLPLGAGSTGHGMSSIIRRCVRIRTYRVRPPH